MKPNYIFIFLIILIIPIIYHCSNKIEYYSALDTYYHENTSFEPSDKKCNCAGPCLHCNEGDDKPNICNDNLSLSNKKCDMKNYDKYRFIYISSKPFNKYLAFNAIDNTSEVYVDPKTPQSPQNISTNYVTGYYLPQKWKLIKHSECIFYIQSYSNNPSRFPIYYLYAKKDGKLGLSLYKKSSNQLWEFIKVGKNMYLIKSNKFCTYLGASDNGYHKINSGLTYLNNLKPNTTLGRNGYGLEYIWNLEGVGNN